MIWKTCSFLLILSLLSGCSAVGFRATKTHQWDFPPMSVSDIDVETYNGVVKIERSDTDLIEVDSIVNVGGLTQELADQRLLEVIPSAEVSDGVLKLRVNELPIGISASVQFVVRVPQVKGVRARTSNGSISVHAPSNVVDAKTSNGKISVRGVTGKLTLVTSNGAIEISDTVAEVIAKTSNGNITAEFVPVGSSNELRTSNGRIDVAFPENRLISINASTSNGAVSCELPLEPGEKQKKTSLMGRTIGSDESPESDVTLRTSNGSIRIRQLEKRSITDSEVKSEENFHTLEL